MSFYVSRQRYFGENQLAIEIACGGKKKAGEDILTGRYDKEQASLVSPVDAVNIALRMLKHWSRDYWDEPKLLALVNFDDKGSKQYFDPNSQSDLDKLNKWAQTILIQMDKCDCCKKPIGNKGVYENDDLPGRTFCSDPCLVQRYREIFSKEPPITEAVKKKKK